MGDDSPQMQVSASPNEEHDSCRSSSDESDDTVIHKELNKQFVELLSESDDNEAKDESDDSVELVVSEIGRKKSKKVYKSDKLPGETLTVTTSEVPKETPQITPPLVVSPNTQTTSTATMQPSIAHQKTLPDVQPKTSQVVENSVSTSSKPASNKEVNQLLTDKISRTNKLKKVVDNQIAIRKNNLKQVLEGNPSNQPDKIRQNKGKAINATPNFQTASCSMGRIPKIRFTLDPAIIEAAIEKVARRRRLSTTYTAISEILLVKQLLSKGNPFKVIPQHAYDISKVPGIRRAHIQQLLMQWEAYLSNYLYQVVQLEFSVEFGDIQHRITTMDEGGENYQLLREFQALVGQDEVSMENFKSSKQIIEIDIEEPGCKKAKTNVVSPEKVRGHKSGSSKKTINGNQLGHNQRPSQSKNDKVVNGFVPWF